MHASKRLMGWTLHSGSIYKLQDFDVASIVSIEDSGTAYTEVGSIAATTASKFYNDRANSTLYIRTTGSDNPNSRFLVLTQKLFFSNVPITLPDDLSSGNDVYWEPMINSTSQFGVEIDTINQASESLEGSGSLTLHNDGDFWPANFDKLFFENKPVWIYSYNRELPVSEAVLLFKGTIEKKSYSKSSIQFGLKDLLAELKSPISLPNIEDLAARTPASIALAKQRMVLGRVYGYRPTNIDQVLDGYPITGTVSILTASTTLTGSGTSFLVELNIDDQIDLGGVKYTIADITSATAATITESFAGANLSGVTATVSPALPKRYINREWNLAGHALREPTVTTEAGCTISVLFLTSTADMYPGDKIYLGTLGSGELVTIDTVVSAKQVTLTQTLGLAPAAGVAVRRPAIQDLRINDVELLYYRDYTLNATTATLTLRDTAEANASPVRQLANNLTFTNLSRTVTGTALTGSIKPGYLVGCVGQADFFEVLYVDSDTSMRLKTAATYSSSVTKGLYKPLIFDPEVHTLTCEILGRTSTGASSGALIATAPALVKELLTDMGLEDSINDDSFTEAEGIAYQPIGLVIPSKFGDTKTPVYKDVINKLNKSVMGSLVQTDAFQFSYSVLQPKKTASALRLREEDILSWSLTSTAEKMVKTSIVTYSPREYDWGTGAESIRTQQKASDIATHILKTTRERTFETFLINEADAEIMANRWALILEHGASRLKLSTKLIASAVEVGDIIDVTHRKLFERYGSSSKRKLVMVESVKKNAFDVDIEAVDLSSAFNRVGNISDFETDWADADDDERVVGGFITDDYGLIDDDPESFGTNLIW
jgi:hypothetical protein